MGTTLTGTTPQDTYDSLIKVTDNGPLSGTAKYLSDGLGNDSALALSTARVGVGTTSPLTTLQVGNTTINNAAIGSSLVRLLSRSTANDVQEIGLGGEGSATMSAIGNLVTDGGSFAKGAIYFATRDVTTNTAPTERMRITSAGNVGIGTSAPAKNLEVSASTDATLRLNSASSAVTSSDILGAVEFFANDSSADGTGIAASINASPDNAFGQGGMLRFNTRLTNAANAIERMRITNEGYVRLATGGIQFNGDTAAANALDDYEEGTWTPTIIGSTTAGTATYAAANGRYTKIGRSVQFEIYISYSSGTGTGNLQIGGLPFTSANSATYTAVSIGLFTNIALALIGNVPLAYVENNSTNITLLEMPSGGGVNTVIPYDAAGGIQIAGTYSV